MIKKTVLSLPVLAFAMAIGTGFAQNQEVPKTPGPLKFYKLEFVLKEVEAGKVLNARSYSMTLAAGLKDSASIRAGSKVVVNTGSMQGQGSYQYIDVGVSIDCYVIREVQPDLSLFVKAEISSMPSAPAVPATTTAPPNVRMNRWSSPIIVPLKKPTLIFSSDDLASKRQMQLELTATPIT